MHWSVKIFIAPALACAVAVSGADAKEKKPGDDTAAAEKKPGQKPPKTTALAVPIPPGHNAEGLRVPYFDENGKLQMYFNIEMARRTDDDHLKMKMAKIETYDENGAPQMTIDLSSSVLDLKTRIITSDSPVKIHRDDFDLTGDIMIFNTQSRRGKVVGNVRMLIFNRDAMVGGAEPKDAGAGESPAESEEPKP